MRKLRPFLPVAFVLGGFLACGGGASQSPVGDGASSGSGSSGSSSGASSSGASSGASSSGSSSGASSGGSSSGDGGGFDATPPPGSYVATFGPITVPGSTERTQCIVVRLKNAGAMHVGSIHNVLSPASHHMIVYRVSDTVERLTPFDCQPFADTLDPSKGAPLMITQKKDDLLTLPQGVAYSIADDQMLRLEVHYINPSVNAVQLTATSTFTPIPDADFRNEAGFLFIGNPMISLPPNATTTLGPSFLPMPTAYSGVKFFAITGHEHRLGTDVVVSVSSDLADPGTSLYDVPGWSWSEPKTVFLDPPVTVPSTSGLRFTCTWNNTTSSPVSFGESADAEMCFFWAYYYPDKGAKVCFNASKASGGYTINCQ